MQGKLKLILMTIIAIVILIAGSIGGYFWYNYTNFISTDDAQVAADFVKVTPLTSGKLLEFDVKEGDYVSKDEIIGRLDADPSVGAEFNIRAPISGIVVSKSAEVGEYESSLAEPTLATLMDPNSLYVNAEIEETKLNKIKVGQKVDITIDEYGGMNFTGTVESIGQATDLALEDIPPQTSGDFTKEVQRVPVKIKFNSINAKLLPGTNAVVKIHIK
jgi:multidrug resistance efflux pump